MEGQNERSSISEETASSCFFKKSDCKSDEEWKFEQVYGFIGKYVKNNVYNNIINETNTKTLLNKIEFLYVSKSGINKIFLLNSFISSKYKDETCIQITWVIFKDSLIRYREWKLNLICWTIWIISIVIFTRILRDIPCFYNEYNP